MRVIDAALCEFKRPAIMCSFGKDSMVVLHLVRQVRKDLPVIFHRDPFHPNKYRFANQVIDTLGLTVYDYPPSATAMQENGGPLEIINYYQVGQRTCMLPKVLLSPMEGETEICGLRDIYQKPLGTFAYPWDLVFHGHKSTDIDPVYGKIPLLADFARNTDSTSACFPIRHFTDADVWEYTTSNGLMIHWERYEQEEGVWREREDKTHNPDYITACTACMVPNGGPVACPRLNGLTISNVAKQLKWADKLNLPYMESKPNGL